MQEVFEKIIEKLNSKKAYFQRFYECEGKSEHDADLNKSTQLAFDDAIEIVKQEAEQYNNGWIPCSERLPEANQMVLATEKDSEYVILCCYEFFEGYGYGFNGSNGNVIAWQPLQQPFHEKGEMNG